MSDPVLFVAPGAGVEPALRGAALARSLGRRGVGVRLLTSYPRAADLERLLGVNLVWIPAPAWEKAAPRYLAMSKPQVLVVDALPWGRSGELSPLPEPPPRVVYLASRVPFERYRQRLGQPLDRDDPALACPILAEPLDPEHHAALEGVAACRALAQPPRLDLERLPEGTRSALEAMLGAGSAWTSESQGGTEQLADWVQACLEDPGP